MADLTLEAFALCWPNDPNYLLFVRQESAEENRKWFKANYKHDRNGNPRGDPFIVRLTGSHICPKNDEDFGQIDDAATAKESP
jgi:hypothetical protein